MSDRREVPFTEHAEFEMAVADAARKLLYSVINPSPKTNGIITDLVQKVPGSHWPMNEFHNEALRAFVFAEALQRAAWELRSNVHYFIVKQEVFDHQIKDHR